MSSTEAKLQKIRSLLEHLETEIHAVRAILTGEKIE